MEFKKATLQEVDSKPSATPKTVGDAIEVQINPASLRLQMANNVDMGKAFARPNTQYQGSSSSTLAFDLVFDTADEGTTEDPVDVRTRTRQLEKFLLPSTATPKSVPPRLQFTYGTLTVVGVMSALNQEFDFFAPNGVPLRAKCAVTIKEQKPEFDAKLAGPGANTGAGATPPLPPGTGSGAAAAPGATPSPPPDRTGTALAGESASDFASRMGLDPRAWKGLAAALDNPLRLDAGLRIDFSASLGVDVGLGVSAGATAGIGPGGAAVAAPPPPAAAAARRPVSPVPAQAPADGAQLTALGGLSRALDRATAAVTADAATKTVVSFAAGGVQAAPPATTASPDSAVVTADPRAVSFGFGVPLRPRLGVQRADSTGLVHERVRGIRPAADDGVPVTDDPTVPHWLALPVVPTTAGLSGTAMAARRAGSGCGCGCGSGGGR